PARGPRRFWRDAARRNQDQGVGLDGRNAVSRGADAARRHRRVERGAARRAGHPRQHGRDGAPEGPSGTIRMSNTLHDMGGMHGFGPVEPEPNEPVFHAEWEGRVLAMQRAMGFTGLWTIDGGRASLETLPPLTYLATSYYQRWFLGLEKRVVTYGLVGEDELKTGRSLRAGRRLNRKLTVADVPTLITRGNFERPAPAAARFRQGDRVKMRNINPETHTRLPRYARGKLGTVEAIRGCHVYPDTAALGDHEHAEWLYTVVISARELWGEEADPNVKVSIEACEPYLDPA